MNRRKFISIGLGVFVAAIIPSSLSAVNFRDTKPKAWSLMNPLKGKKVDASSLNGINSAMKELYGTSTVIEGKVKLKAPDIAENGALVPITISSDLNAKTVALFQNANPEATVAVFNVPANGIVYYSLRIKMGQTGTVTAVVESGGKLYSATRVVKVTKGGCGG
ncbi:MAG: thiosulfate oxidation carrier protein SoxY [Epsilonproteobacteria bacterium]|nr:MAG: thiosulfate oxidation carrier protein SoxY [Campylobacterota bacterium]